MSLSMYQPLPHTQCTRVLEFVSSTSTSHGKLTFRMITVDVGKIPSFNIANRSPEELAARAGDPDRFDAVSYTWGSPVSGARFEGLYTSSSDVEINIITGGNTTSVKVGLNIHDALVQICATTYQRPLWVDAICINQPDLVERSKHVLLMSQIYSKAYRVLIWLGKDVFNDFKQITWLHETVLDAMDSYFAQSGPLVRSDFVRPFSKVNASDDEKGVTVYPMDNFLLPDEALAALFRFYATRRYFSRAWVRQEIALSREAVVLFEHQQVDYMRLARLPMHLNDLGGLAAIYVHDTSAHPSIGTEVVELGRNIMNLQYFGTNSMRTDLQSLFGSYDEPTTYFALLVSFLAQGSKRLATDPRDQIYCLLGMVQSVLNVGDLVKPDYTASIEEVYINFTILLLMELPHRSVLSFVAAKPSHSQYVRSLPSWVPDYSSFSGLKNAIQTILTGMLQKIPALGAGLDGPSQITISGQRLKVFARRCGTIDYTFHATRQGPISSRLVLKDVHQMIGLMKACVQMKKDGKVDLFEPLFRVICYGEPLIEGEDFFRMYWRKFLADCVVECRKLYPSDSAALQDCQELAETYVELGNIPSVPSLLFIQKTEILFDALQAEEYDQKSLADAMLKLCQVYPEYPYNRDLHDKVNNPGEEEEDDDDNNNDDDESSSSDSSDTDDDVWREHALEFYKSAKRRPDPRLLGSHTFFTTDTRNVGRVTTSVRPGDELWLICQAKVPFILRPIGQEFQLIEETFVYEGMYGELLQDGKSEEPREITII